MRITEKAIANLEDIKQNIPEWARDAILENDQYIISILQDKQLSEGKDSYGKYVGFYKTVTEQVYSQDPANRPRKPKISGEPYNFEWSGEFFDSMNIKINAQQQGYDIFSSTGKDRFLETIFKTELTKFTDENNDFVNKTIIEPYIAKKISESLFAF